MTAPYIVEIYGHDMPNGKCIDGVILSDGTILDTQDVSPEMWAAAGVVQVDGQPVGGRSQ